MIRIRRILVQADAPDASMSAFALHLARLYRAEISLLHTTPRRPRGARALFNRPAETDSSSCAEERPAEALNRPPAFDHRPCRTLRCSGTIPKILETLRGARADLFVQRAKRPTLRIRPLFPDRTIRTID
ncbi:MAG: universal stress protein, partial [Syntrophales bacterium]|nr:universal stress protein [Syntrophales bacterium]